MKRYIFIIFIIALFIPSISQCVDNATQITSGAYNDWRPRWSPDGSRITFYSHRHPPANGKDFYWDIFIVNSSGGNVERITYTDWALLPSWSSDSNELLYSRWEDRWQVWKIDLITGIDERVGDVDPIPCEEYAPHYSPDGADIVYSARYDNNWDLYAMTASGDNVTRLTTSAATDSYPTYSPDGQWILFSSDRSGSFDIYKMQASGGTPELVVGGPDYELYSEWSPDGSTIAFSSNRSGDFDIYTIPATGGDITRITDSPADDYYPTWSPDSANLAFYSNRTGTFHIYRIPADGVNIESSSLGRIKAEFK